MLPPGLGWSAGDIVMAIKIIKHVYQSFKDANDVDGVVAEATNFLGLFGRSLDRISNYFKSLDIDTEHQKDIEGYVSVISTEYCAFEKFLREKCKLKERSQLALENSLRERLCEKTEKAIWHLTGLPKKVLELKKAIKASWSALSSFLSLKIIDDFKSSKQELKDQTTTLLRAINDNALSEKVFKSIKALEDNNKNRHITQTDILNRVDEAIRSMQDAAIKQDEKLQKANATKDTILRQVQIDSRNEIITAIECLSANYQSSLDIYLERKSQQQDIEDSEMKQILQRVEGQMWELAQIEQPVEVQKSDLQTIDSNPRRTSQLTQKFLKAVEGILIGIDKASNGKLTGQLEPVIAALRGSGTMVGGFEELFDGISTATNAIQETKLYVLLKRRFIEIGEGTATQFDAIWSKRNWNRFKTSKDRRPPMSSSQDSLSSEQTVPQSPGSASSSKHWQSSVSSSQDSLSSKQTVPQSPGPALPFKYQDPPVSSSRVPLSSEHIVPQSPGWLHLRRTSHELWGVPTSPQHSPPSHKSHLRSRPVPKSSKSNPPPTGESSSAGLNAPTNNHSSLPFRRHISESDINPPYSNSR